MVKPAAHNSIDVRSIRTGTTRMPNKSKGIRRSNETMTIHMELIRRSGASWGWIAKHFSLDKSNVRRRILKYQSSHGEIGKHTTLKMLRRKPCLFKSGCEHQIKE